MGDLTVDYRCVLSVVGTALLLGLWGLGLWVRFLVGLWTEEMGRRDEQ